MCITFENIKIKYDKKNRPENYSVIVKNNFLVIIQCKNVVLNNNTGYNT